MGGRLAFCCNHQRWSFSCDGFLERGWGEGAGFRPVELLSVALGGCAGIDVVSILKKKRQKVEGLEMVISGERVENPPFVYSWMHVEYIVHGKDISEKAVRRAI